MKLDSEDPRITAYALGELGPDDAVVVAQAAATDPQLQAKIVEIASIQQFLSDRLNPPAKQLLPRQRENIRRRARQADLSGKLSAFTSTRGGRKFWLIPAAAAAVLVVTTFVLTRPPAAKLTPLASNAAAPPASPSPVLAEPPPEPSAPVPLAQQTPEPSAPVSASPVFIQHGSVTPSDFPTLALPVLTEKSNLASISTSIRDARQLPPHAAVRLEEILNSFQLRLNGVAAIARSTANSWHPDGRDSGISRYTATLNTEMIACPWKPSATLLLISIRANAENDCAVKIAYLANPQNVFRYRLLGFSSTAEAPTDKLPSKLAANSTSTLAIEIEPSTPGDPLGSLEWSIDDKPAPSIALAHKRDTEPTDDARFAALVCTYAQWLAGEQIGIIDAEIVAALAREIAATNLPPDRADLLSLIDQSLHL